MRNARTMGTTLLALWVGLLPGCSRDDLPDDFVRLMNVGKAHLENRNSKDALAAFKKAVKLEPKSAAAYRNLARSYRLAGKRHESAFKVLSKALALDQSSAAAHYLLGLTLVSLGQTSDAAGHLEDAVRLDPSTPQLHYQLALANQTMGNRERAVEQFLETVRLDPLHASAHFALGTHARLSGNMTEFKKRFSEFDRLRKLFGNETRTVDALEKCIHTMPESAPGVRVDLRPPIPVNFVATTLYPTRTAATAIIDVDDQGRCTLGIVLKDGATELVRIDTLDQAGRRSRFKPALRAPTPTPGSEPKGRFHTALAADYHNDIPVNIKTKKLQFEHSKHALNDLLIFGDQDLRLLKRTDKDTLVDVTEFAGLANLSASSAVWVDYEHDGDVDLLLGRASGLELWQNNGDGRFQNVTEQVGLPDIGPVVAVAAVDLDENIAVDLIASTEEGKTYVFTNQRAGRFALRPDPPGPWPSADQILVNDINNDGHMDVVLVGEHEAIVILGKTSIRQRIDLSGIQVARAILLDYDNDGRLDILAAGAQSSDPGKGSVRLWRNADSGVWTDVSASTGLAALDIEPVRSVVTADLDVDGDTDLLLVTMDGAMHTLTNEGGNANNQLKLRLETIKTNPAGLGARVELRDRDFKVIRLITRLPIEIGLGSRSSLDTIQLVWTNAVVDNQIEVSISNMPMTLVERNVAVGSCPLLHAWDGETFRFVTDLLGNAPIGLSLRRDEMLPADPDEIVKIGGSDIFAIKDGTYRTVIANCFREVVYLDHTRLIAVDHPPDVEVHPTDKLMPAPFPKSRVWALTNRAPLRKVMGDDGIDRTSLTAAMDNQFAPPGVPLPPPFRGMCHPLALTMDFGNLDVGRPLVLAMTGWLQYGDASTNIALSQSSTITVIPPMLEVETQDGAWQRVDVVVGMPAGKTKTILTDLSGKLPSGARRLRLTTTFEIRWDRLALFERTTLPQDQFRTVGPDSAELRWHGFSEMRSRGPGQPTTPDFDVVTEFPPWRHTLSGWCTNYGNVLELVEAQDDRLVVFNSGDVLELRFEADRFTPPPAGMTRTFFFYSVGWEKDGDHNVVGGDQVGRLPSSKSGAPIDPDDDWETRFNTRWVPTDRFELNR